MIKIAIVGIGHVAQFHLDAISKVSGIDLVGAYDVDPIKANKLPSSVIFYKSLDTLLNKSLADVILISTPNLTHYELGAKIIERGRAVLLEKPVCTTQQELDLLIDLSARRKQFVHVALHAAFARDVEWWNNNSNNPEYSYGDLVGFNAGFFDPYIDDGKVSEVAAGLGGSWIDSGINALSVISKYIEPTLLSIDEARHTVLDGYNCLQIQGESLMTFQSGKRYGHGIIDTNWSLGVNRKTTRLWYEDIDILLHHSLESVYCISSGKLKLLRDLRNDNARLTNHYISLFNDLIKAFRKNESNIKHAYTLHRLLFEAMRNKDFYRNV